MRHDPRAPLPVCVDMDGTLLATDSLVEAVLMLLRRSPWIIFLLPLWLLSGRAAFKSHIAARVTPDFARLPVHAQVLEWLDTRAQEGSDLWLCTGAPQQWADAAAQHFGIFRGAMGSSPTVNLTSGQKARALVEKFGDRGFIYCGNEGRDLNVWAHSAGALVVGSSALAARAQAQCEVLQHVNPGEGKLRSWLKALRVHQWAKNLLVFVPLLAAHHALDAVGWGAAALCFAAFCLLASGLYVLNDLMDLPADRMHPTKNARPFASGRLQLTHGAVAVPLLIGCAFALAAFAPLRLSIVLVVYAVVTLAYSLGLKRVAMLDTLMLAGLYTLRILAGSVAVQVPLSFWLLAFSGFLFFSLAMVKRSTELRLWERLGTGGMAGRGYSATDRPLVDAFGAAAGLLAVLVLALYLNSPDVRVLYTRPNILWALCPVLTWWICRVWLLVHRDEMNDDPVVFALSDRASLVGAVVAAVIVWSGT